VLSRQWRHVDFKKGTLRLDPGEAKNDEPREIFLTARLRQILEGQKTKVDALKGKRQIVPWVFFRMVANGRGGPKQSEPITSLSKWFKRACRESGLQGRRPHDLRRSAVRQFVRQGISTHVAMMLTGHKTDDVFRRYDIISEDDRRAAAALIDAASVKIG
jgi:integrase